MKRVRNRLLLGVIGLVTVASLAVAGIAGAADPTNLTSVKVDKAPTIDGQVDSLWNSAPGVTLDVAGGANLPAGATKVNLYSVYTSDSVYFLAEYWDPSQSLRRAPWQKQADGTWKKLSDPNDKGGDNNLVYEDKLAFLWNINDSIKGFNEIGCAAVCHAGEPPKPFGNKYTASKGELGDIWHWKSVRTNPNGQIDDQYLDDTRYDATNSPEAGRKSDPKTAGGYSDNQTDDKKAPKYAAPDQKPAPPYWIFDKDKVALDDTKYKANDEVAGIITAPIQGDRGDISAQGAWKDGKWTLEWGRKLNTGSQFDVQYADLSKSYAFGVAVFDNAAVRHATSGLAKLTFEQAAAPAPTALPRTGGPTVPVLPIALGAGILAILGFALRLKLARR